MLGAIIGDIVGSRFEFNNIKTKKFKLFDKGCKVTDDSVMSVAIAEMCLKGYVPDNKEMIIKTFKKWGQRYPNVGYGNNFIKWVLSDNPLPYNSYGNGSAMRISAIGYYAKTKEEVEMYTKAVTEVTHNHPEGIKGAYVTAMSIFMARFGSTKNEIKAFVQKYYNLDFDYEHLRKTYKHEAEICQNTVPQAIYCFLISKGFEDCLRTTISIGGDCDTTAAISCSIAEAYYGIPKRIQNEVQTYIPNDLNEIIKRFDQTIKLESMTKYGEILRFIKPLEEYDDKLVYWHSGTYQKDKDGKNVFKMGYPVYEAETIDFLHNMGPFMVHNYVEIIESRGIKYENIDIQKLDLTKYDDKLILALLTAIIRSDRIIEGLILSMIENGSILKLLKRLKDFDEPLRKEDIITKIEYSFSCFGDFTQNETFIINIISKDQVRVEYSSYKLIKKIQPVKLLDKDDSKTLIEKLNNLNILDWNEHYEPVDKIILDGESWNLEIETINLGKINKSGNNAFPNNWHEFREFRRWIVEKLSYIKRENNYVHAHISNISFPKSIEELEVFIDEHGCYNVEDIINSSKCEEEIWTVPRYSCKGDIVLFFHAKTTIQWIRKLETETKYLSNDDHNIPKIKEWLNRARNLYNKYGGKIFAIGEITSTPEYECTDEIFHWSGRIYANISNIVLLDCPIDISEFKEFLLISRQSAITYLPNNEYIKLKQIIIDKNENLPLWFKNSEIYDKNLANINSENFLDINVEYRRKYLYEIEFRSYYVDYLLKKIANRKVYRECTCYCNDNIYYVDNCISINGKYILIEVKLNINIEKDLIEQLNHYLYSDYVIVDKEKIIDFETQFMLVIDTNNLYKYTLSNKKIEIITHLDEIRTSEDITRIINLINNLS